MLIEKCLVVSNRSTEAIRVAEAGTSLTVVIVSGEAAGVLCARQCGSDIRISLADLVHGLRREAWHWKLLLLGLVC